MIINIKCQPSHTVHKAELYLQKSIQGSVIVVEKETNSSMAKTQVCTVKNITHRLSLDDSNHVWQLVYLVEVYDVDYPGTEPCSSWGFLSYKFRIELRVTEVFFSHTPYCGLGDVLFVKGHQSLQEVVHLDVRAFACVKAIKWRHLSICSCKVMSRNLKVK